MISKTFVGAGKSGPGRMWRGHGEDELLFANAEEEFFHEVRPLVGARRRAPGGSGLPRSPSLRQSPRARPLCPPCSPAAALTWCVAHAGSQLGDECGEETVCERAQGGWCF